MSLIAKQIVKDQLWIVTDGVNKVGNLESLNGSLNLRIGGTHQQFPDAKAVQRMVAIQFQRPKTVAKSNPPWAIWPTSGRTYNSMFDVKRKLHVYTKTKKSRCYHAAGWFRMKAGDGWTTIFCPKYIFIQRYEWTGPYSTKEEAEGHK